MKKRIFSGIQPSGNLHIGNYLGAIRQWVSLQREYDSIFCIVDLHAITIPQQPDRLKTKIREVAGLLIAAGIDPERSPIFIQSHVSAHAELAWIMECVMPIGWLKRMTQYKQKAKANEQSVSAGLFNYPALMAADILLYDTEAVPVGDDQRQHLELARQAAHRFNSIFGETFRIPQAITAESGARIMSLDDPTSKMSKSNASPSHAIYLLDSPDQVNDKVSHAMTDSLKDIRFDEQRPGINNLLYIYRAFTGLSQNEIESHFEGKGYSELKRELAEVINSQLQTLQARYHELAATPGYIDRILSAGEEQVRPQADKMLSLVKDRMGLG